MLAKHAGASCFGREGKLLEHVPFEMLCIPNLVLEQITFETCSVSKGSFGQKSHFCPNPRRFAARLTVFGVRAFQS